MRLFVGFRLSREVTEKAQGVVEKLKRAGEKVSWVAPPNYHLTLKFLGSVPDDRLPEIEAAVREVGQANACFRLRARGVGTFPGAIWIGAHSVPDELRALVLAVEERFEKLGFARETRPWVAHLTLGRIKEAKDLQARAKAFSEQDFGESEVTEIILFESQTLPTGAVYRELVRVPLLRRS